MAVGIGYLAKKFAQTEADLIEALKECGFAIPTGAKDEPAYLEYDGDLYWLNVNNRGQLWINTREKPPPGVQAGGGKESGGGGDGNGAAEVTGRRIPEKKGEGAG